jgi:cobalt-zinc-cadmium efflux system outer membrane protein
MAAPVLAQQAPASTPRRAITLADAVDIFLRQNLDLVAARYDIDTAEAEKLTARLRPNPEVDVEFEDLPVDFTVPFSQQTFTYTLSQTIELGGKRRKRIDAAAADAEVSEGGDEE